MVPRGALAALDATSGMPIAWNPGLDGPVYALVTYGNSLYVGGVFSQIAGSPRGGVAEINLPTMTVTPWSAGIACAICDPYPPEVLTIARPSVGNVIYLGGIFTSAGGQARNNITAVDATTGAVLPFNVNANDWVYSLALQERDVAPGNLDEAAQLYEESLDLARRDSDDRSVISYLWNLAAVDIAMGRRDRARQRLREAGDLMGTFKPGAFLALAEIDPTSALASASGDMAIAARLAGAAAGIAEKIKFTREPVDEQFIGSWVDRMRQALGNDAFEADFAAGRQLEWQAALQEALAWLAGESGP
jgi:tetratricopeptide repeat protein